MIDQHTPPPARPADAHGAPAKSRLVPWLIGLPVGIFGVLMLVGLLIDDPQSKQRWIDRETIKVCWKQIAKPQEERKTQVFQSKADCEQLEFAYKSRYNENP